MVGITSWKRLAAVCLALLLAVSVGAVRPSQGAAPGLDTIRVAIFLNLPNKYTQNTSWATFSSAGGLSVGFREPAGAKTWDAIPTGEQIRFSLDDYKVKLAETADFNAAKALLKQVQDAKGAGKLISLSKNGKTVYQVIEGGYANAAEGKKAVDRWNGAGLKLQSGAVKPVLQGPFHLETGGFASEAEARQAADAFGASGVDAFVALRGAGAYTVMLGAAADAAGLNAVKSAVAGAGGEALRQADASAPYLLVQNDHTVSGQANAAIRHYAVPLTGTKAWIAPSGAEPIKLTERYGRTYRGAFEASGFNGKLAVVNELPFEQYLYSVVGAEMPASWPAEALKAQAVAARSYALYQGVGFQIAHVVDTVASQAYGGTGAEKAATIAAVNATAGEVLMHGGKVIEALFSSSAGGATADGTEVWGNAVPYLKSVSSPDEVSEKGLLRWYRIVMPNGETGYVREDFLRDTGLTNAAGAPILEATGDGVNVRPIPLVQDSVAPVGTLNRGTRVVSLGSTFQSNPMSWVRGPFTSEQLLATLKGKTATAVTGPIRTLEVTGRGPSGRVTEMTANGQKLDVRYPDIFRSALGSLPSTRFTVDETARLSIESGAGARRELPADSNPLYVLGASGSVRQAPDPGVFVLDGNGKLRATTKEPGFRFVGTGNGHGLGLSQYGALGLARQGYDYQRILKYYYPETTIAKG
ncbi:SpoIID/LytB domain-containing protein [Paenibacillus cisolokensis]|uniref:SpoIID/LytB domain-containing protein n=1 Tax=Paenibacillus cisolokensis TaxID=1658519 RepID=UPI003D29773F